jgi:ribosome-associated protein
LAVPPEQAPVRRKEKQTLTTALRREETHLRSPRLATARRELAAAAALKVVLHSLEDSKAEDLVSIDLAGKTPIADHMVVATGRSHRHVAAVADRLVADLKKAGATDIRVEGQRTADWVLVDAGDVVVHIFRPDIRTFYNLEKMWQADHPGAPVAV